MHLQRNKKCKTNYFCFPFWVIKRLCFRKVNSPVICIFFALLRIFPETQMAKILQLYSIYVIYLLRLVTTNHQSGSGFVKEKKTILTSKENWSCAQLYLVTKGKFCCDLSRLIITFTLNPPRKCKFNVQFIKCAFTCCYLRAAGTKP